MPCLSQETMMANSSSTQPPRRFEVRFQSLFHEGRAMAFPCDSCGVVSLDALSEKARKNYLFARGMVGREYAMPLVQENVQG